ncbi:MAG: hypothetical protein L0387_42890 [Acidobacteria bacterium]|nr:hypothetical protein [Acidobacteriota bacterium]
MKAMQPRNEPHLDAREIQEQVLKRLEKYKDLNVLEQFAMFMGMAQVLEVGLKNLLGRRYKYDYEKMETWTLGKTTRELKERGLRTDFIVLLESVVEYRNYIAHELLVNDAMLKCLLSGDSGRVELRQLEKGIYELEQVVFLHDWCEEHNAWG